MRSTRLARPTLDPAFATSAKLVGWCWIAVIGIVAIAFSALSPRLPTRFWYVFIGGRSSSPQLFPAPTTVFVVAIWIVVVALAILAVLARVVRGPVASQWMLVLLILAVVGAAAGAAVLVAAIPAQLDAGDVIARGTATSILSPGNSAGTLAIIVALLTMLGIPTLFVRRARAATR